MSGWEISDSDYMTTCLYCGNKIIPHLIIFEKDLINNLEKFTKNEPIIFLSPIVLKKDLDLLIENNNNEILSNP